MAEWANTGPGARADAHPASDEASDEWRQQTKEQQQQRRYTKVIRLKQGSVQGRVRRAKWNGYLAEVDVYLGIPYAAPPVGSLRFMPPGAPPQWTDTLDAVHVKPVCPQMLPDTAKWTPQQQQRQQQQRQPSTQRRLFVERMKRYLQNESEDCLYLNVYVPVARATRSRAENQRYPVVLFVHGESFEWNSGNLYDGSTVAAIGNVIFVTINFRLGIFDQIAALQWIKANIGEFGGDATRITVMGHGTGAACVNFLMLSPVAEGLFHRAILMSGSALSEWALTASPLHYIQLKDEFNCSLDNVIDCLQRKRKEDIMSAFQRYELPPFENFTPVVDEIVVLNSPADQMDKYTLFSKYDLLAGVSQVESYYLLDEEYLKFGMLTHEGHSYLDKYIRAVFKKTPDKALMATIEHYLGRLKDNSPMATRNAVLDALSDLLVTAPLLKTVRYHAVTPRNTFLYVFGHRTYSETAIKTNYSIYGDELPYALGVPLDGPTYHYQSKYTALEQQLSEAVIRYLSNFAKTGNPYSSTSSEFSSTPHSTNRLSNIRWPPYNLDKQSYMYFDTPTQIRHGYRSKEDQFWNQAQQAFLRHFDEAPSAADDTNGRKVVGGGVGGDRFENDENRNPLVYGLPPSVSADGEAVDNNFFNLPRNGGWGGGRGGNIQIGEEGPMSVVEIESASPTAVAVGAAQSSTFTATALVVVALLFLLANVVAFGFVYYQRGRLRLRENLFRNRFRCKTVSVPDLFEESENGDIYAVAECRRRRAADNVRSGGGGGGGVVAAVVGEMLKRGDRSSKKLPSKKKKEAAAATSLCYGSGRRVASVKPEAMSGKRMRRWPLSRQCSGSTISVDAHSKVRNWIRNEVVATTSSRWPPRGTASAKTNAVANDDGNGGGGAIELRTIERCHRPQGDHPAGGDGVANSCRRPGKISIAVDATPAARTGSVLEQTPVEAASGWPPRQNDGPALGSLPTARLVPACPYDAQHAAATHKSSAHIRLRTPQFLLEALPASHSHSRSEPSVAGTDPTAPNAPPLFESLYSGVDRSRDKHPTSSADSASQQCANAVEHGRDRGELTCVPTPPSTADCAEINVTSLPDFDHANAAPPTSQETLCNLARRNFPKVLPDLRPATQTERKRANRLSLPATGYLAAERPAGCVDCYSHSANHFGRARPTPPPRLTSTLGRRAAPASGAVAGPAPDAIEQVARVADDRQLGPARREPTTIVEEKSADIVQTESSCGQWLPRR